MIFQAFAILAAITGSAMPSSAVIERAMDVRIVALDSEPLFDGADGRERTARLLAEWMGRESAGNADAMGDCDADEHGKLIRTVATCRSFGAMQSGRMWLGERIPEVLASRRLGLRIGLDVMRLLAAKCGSVRGGLLAYASGSCTGTPRARALVSARCAASGAC